MHCSLAVEEEEECLEAYLGLDERWRAFELRSDGSAIALRRRDDDLTVILESNHSTNEIRRVELPCQSENEARGQRRGEVCLSGG